MKALKSVYWVKNLAIGTALSALAVSQVSCLQDSGPGQGCTKPFDVVITPDSIQGRVHIYIAPEKLDAFTNPKVVIKDAFLEVTLRGRHHKTKDLTLSLNGIKISRRDGGETCEDLRADKISDVSKSKFPLHKMFLNGALPFHFFIAKLKNNRGLLKLSVLGSHVDILDARMVINGTKTSAPIGEDGKCDPGGEDIPVEKPSVVRIVSASPSEPLTNSTSMQIAFAADRSGETFYCSLDSNPAEICQSPKIYSGVSNGSHVFNVYAKSPKGLQSNTVTYQWSVDSQPPTAVITNAATLPTLTNSNNISFEFSANETGKLVCSLDGAPYQDCMSPLRLMSLTEGTHSFAVNVIDLAGNTGNQPARFDWTIDQTPPSTSLISVEPSASLNNVNHKSFSFAANESASLECSVDNGPFSACTSPVNLDGLSEGRHWFEVRATDLAGNLGPSNTYAWNIDLTAPELRVISLAPAEGLSGAKSIQVAFESSEESSLVCRFNDEEIAPCHSPFSRADLPEGSHKLRIEARDLAGNVASPVELNWRLDFTSPQISFASLDPAAKFIRSNSLTAVVEASESSSLLVSLNGLALDQNRSPITLNNPTEGHYVLTVEAVDSVGNHSNSLTHEFTIDLTAPQITSLASSDPRDLVNFDSRSFVFSSNETDVNFQCELDEAGFESCLSPVDLSGLADGRHTFSVRALDSAGNVGESVSHSWTIDTRSPVVSISAQVNGTSAQFDLSADEIGVTFECSLDGSAFNSCTSPVNYTGLSAGAHTFIARGKDLAGNSLAGGTPYPFEIAIPIKTQIDNLSPGGSLVNQRSLTVSFSSNIANATFLCSVDGATPSACTAPFPIDGLSDGAHTFQVQAVDIQGNVDSVGAVHTWTVDATAPTVPSLSLSVTSTSITITWTTSEPASSQAIWGLGSNLDRSTAEDLALNTSRQIRLDGLTANTVYSVQVTGRDAAGNIYISAPRQIRTSR